ncbi:MAG: DUF2490 domain-containing protein [Saprospiraceae bacterium]
MKKWLLCSTLLLAAICTNGQTIEEDFTDVELWTAVGFKYDFHKRFSFELEEQFRLKDNLSTFSQLFTEGTLTYDPGKVDFLKPLELSLSGRHITRNDTKGKQQGIEYFFRYNLDADYELDFNRFSVGYRFRFQSRNQLGISELEGDIPINDIRHKVSLEYNIKDWKIDPKLSFELFSRNDDQTTYEIARYRVRLGSDYSFVKRQDLSFFVMYEKELNQVEPETLYGIGLKYEFGFKRKNKK